MKKFEGNINGKIYTDDKEFNKALLELEKTDDMFVSYKFTSVPDESNAVDSSKEIDNRPADVKYAIRCDKNYVSENQYIKNITNEKDVKLNIDLENKLKCATNKHDIKRNVCKRISDFVNKIEDNLLHINELKSDYKKLDEKMKLISSQIKTLDDANNNYYLNKEYYTNIKNLLDTPVDIPETKCECNCDPCECKCNNKNNNDKLSLKDIYDMSPYELAKYLNKRKIYTLADLVEYFLKN